MPSKVKSAKSSNSGYGKSPRQKKVKKEGPKKALTAYMLFSMARREQIVKEKPELRSNVTEMSKIIGAEWRQMTTAEKEPYQREHERAKERYLREKEMFAQHGSLPHQSSSETSVNKSHFDGDFDRDEEEDDDDSDEHQHSLKRTSAVHKSHQEHKTTAGAPPKSSGDNEIKLPEKRQRQETSHSTDEAPNHTSSPPTRDPHFCNSIPSMEKHQFSSYEQDSQNEKQKKSSVDFHGVRESSLRAAQVGHRDSDDKGQAYDDDGEDDDQMDQDGENEEIEDRQKNRSADDDDDDDDDDDIATEDHEEGNDTEEEERDQEVDN